MVDVQPHPSLLLASELCLIALSDRAGAWQHGLRCKELKTVKHMAKPFRIVTTLTLCAASFAESNEYYKATQKA
jgi:hypothetical protein